MSDTYNPAMFLTVKGKRIDWRATDDKVAKWLLDNDPIPASRALQHFEITWSLRKLVKKHGTKAIIAAMELLK